MDENITKLIEDCQKEITVLKSEVKDLKDKTESRSKKMTVFLISNTLDKVIPAMGLINWGLSMGYEVNVYFSMWAINLVRKKTLLKENTVLEKMAKMMMPAGQDKLILSQMHMMGVGTAFMKRLMKEHNSASFNELFHAAAEMGAKYYACVIMMATMGIKEEELADEVKPLGGVSWYKIVSESSINYVI